MHYIGAKNLIDEIVYIKYDKYTNRKGNIMKIVNVRVDDRLVHGVVTTNWVPSLKIQRVIVIDSESANTPLLKSSLRMATPRDVYLSVIELEKAIDNLLNNKYGEERLMIVVKSLEPIIGLIDSGVNFETLVLGNMGNISKSSDRVAITKYISVNSETIDQINYIDSKGIRVIAQLIPTDNDENFIKTMNSKL